MAEHDQVLLISNDGALAAGLREGLRETDVELRVGHDGASGLRQAWELLPAVVVLDADLRGPSGFVVGNVLRENPRLAELPLVMVSKTKDQASLDQHGQDKSRAGAYVPAPAKADDVLKAITEQLAASRRKGEDRDARIGRLSRIPADEPQLPSNTLSYLILLIVAGFVAALVYYLLE